MRDRRRVTFTANELIGIQRALESRIEMCIFRVNTARERKRMQLWAGECTHAIAAYRKGYAFPSGRVKTGQIADHYARRLATSVEGWSERNGPK